MPLHCEAPDAESTVRVCLGTFLWLPLSLLSFSVFETGVVWISYSIQQCKPSTPELESSKERIREECVLDPISILGGFNGAFVQFILDLLTIKMTNYWGRSCDSCVVNEK